MEAVERWRGRISEVTSWMGMPPTSGTPVHEFFIDENKMDTRDRVGSSSILGRIIR